jgi:ABC-type oligopeptide transport system substrate-binding subunit
VAPGTRISFLAFNCNKKPFDNPKVRQAFELVLDRERLCSEILNGDGTPADKGFVPPSQYYDNSKLNFKKTDIKLAQSLLQAAGFNAHNPFPKIVLYIVGSKKSLSSKWCEAYSKDLKKDLGVTLKIMYCDFKTRDAAIKNKAADLWKVGWVADYPDPESYFNLFFNSESNNSDQVAIPRLQNIAYNAAFSRAAIETNNKKRNELFVYCDKILQENYIILPVVIDDFVAVINLKVRHLELNPLGLVDFTEVYKKDLK